MRLRAILAGLCFVHLSYGQCPDYMVLAKPKVCIDMYEYSSMPAELGRGAPFLAASGLTRKQDVPGVIWDATSLCALQGKRTCDLQEWVAACRGPAWSQYPYGEVYDPAACNTNKKWRTYDDRKVFLRDVDELQRLDQSAAVGSFPRCVSAAGAYDMVGNAEEWVRCDEGKYGWCLAGGYWAHPQPCTEAVIIHSPYWHLYETSFRCCFDLT